MSLNPDELYIVQTEETTQKKKDIPTLRVHEIDTTTFNQSALKLLLFVMASACRLLLCSLALVTSESEPTSSVECSAGLVGLVERWMFAFQDVLNRFWLGLVFFGCILC